MGSVNHEHAYAMNYHVRVRDMHVHVRDMQVHVRDMHVHVRDMHVHVHVSGFQASPVPRTAKPNITQLPFRTTSLTFLCVLVNCDFGYEVRDFWNLTCGTLHVDQMHMWNITCRQHAR